MTGKRQRFSARLVGVALLAGAVAPSTPAFAVAPPTRVAGAGPPSAAPAPAPLAEAYVVRLGYTTFESPEAVRSSSTLHSVNWYLDRVAQKSRLPPWKRPLQFELMIGNYYQVWWWFKSGQIDAAVVSPFVAMLLERDGQALSVLEFSEGDEPAAHYPVVRATGRWRDDPQAGVVAYLEGLLDAARAGNPDSAEARGQIAELRRHYRFDLVSHLSSSGFIMPLLFAQAWLDDPARGDLDADLRNRFWSHLFANGHLTLAHGGTPAPPPVSTLAFGYERSAAIAAGEGPFGPWRRYQAGRLPYHSGAPSIPNDVLVLRRQIAQEALGMSGGDRARLGEQLTSAEMQAELRARRGSYREVRWFNADVQGPFREEASRLFGREARDSVLARLDSRWFDAGRFDFTIDETMAFLRQDQESSGIARLAVVLSGGGVKSLYQTVLLDHLYGYGPPSARVSERWLRNYDEAPWRSVGPTPKGSAGPLTVHTLIGTSGGAMLAFFAAQVPQVGPLRGIVAATSQRPLFPNADLPRLLSVLVLLGVVYVVLLVAKTLGLWGLRRDAAEPVAKRGSRKLVALELLLVLAGAAAVVTTRSEYLETVPVVEALFFIATGIAVHFGISCIAQRREGAPEQPAPQHAPQQAEPQQTAPLPTAPQHPTPRQPVPPGSVSRRAPPRHAALAGLATFALLFGAQLVVVAVAARYVIGPGTAGLHELRFPALSVLASAGVFVVAAALAAGAAAGRWGLAVHRAGDWAAALLAVATIVALAFLPLVAATLADLGTLLELTGLYWLGLLLAAPLATLLVLRATSAPRSPFARLLRRGIVELIRDRRGVVTTTLAGTMVATFAFCIGCWCLLVAPAVYSNVKAVRAFAEALPEEQLWSNRFRSNLVVTGTLLREKRCSPTEVIHEGGLYFCFEGAEGCGAPGRGQWQVFRRPVAARAVDAVFASGSAFPVFPPHRAHLPDGCEVRLVDGGYAHNVPLEAASLSSARQVLMLNASPDPLDAEVVPPQPWQRALRESRLEGGQLVRSSPDVVAFMFERAQELDRSIGGDLVVASLTPRPRDGWWPFLLDFRPGVRRKLLEAADRDIAEDHRIGQVLSWGRPVLLPGLDDLPPPWSFADGGAVAPLLASPGAGRDAAFDLDNTLLRGDVGDAMLLATAVELRYHGELPAFWALFPDERAREELRAYWRRFSAPGQPRRAYDRPVDWSPDFTDYVVLFLRQYQRLLDEPDGARRAYPWAAQLLVGMTPGEVTALAEDVWGREMRRSEGPVEVRSARYGTQKFEGGIRARRQMAELVTGLQRSGWNVWIVTASNVWAGRVAARALGVPEDHVLGIALRPRPGSDRLSAEVAPPVTYREGKVAALRERGVDPELAAGDSPTDLEMLRAARLAVVVDRGKIAERELSRDWVLIAPGAFRAESLALPPR